MPHIVELSDRSVDLDTGRVTGHPDLRAMELKVLRYLAERVWEVVTHDELLVRVWGYRPGVQTRTIYATWHRLKSALEVDPSEPRHLLTVSGKGVRLVGVGGGPPWLTNLAAAGDRLIGREAELALLAGGQAPLVSLLGTGGAGKTRLAVEHAWRVRGSFPGGAWSCDLASASGPEEAAERLARALGVPLPNPSTDLGPHLASRLATLIILDEADTVPGLPSMLSALLDQAPQVRWIVTGHQALGLQGEQRVTVLELPVSFRMADAVAVLGEPPVQARRLHAEHMAAQALQLARHTGGVVSDRDAWAPDEVDSALAAARVALDSPDLAGGALLLECAVRFASWWGRATAARALASQVLQHPPTEEARIRVSAWHARDLVRQGRTADAMALWTRLPADALAAGLPAVAAVEELRIGMALRNQGDAQGAVQALARSRAAEREIGAATPRLRHQLRGARAHLEASLPGASVQEIESLHTAVLAYTEAEMPETAAVIRQNLAAALFFDERYEQAEIEWSAAMASLPEQATRDRALCWAGLARVSSERARTAEALERIELAVLALRGTRPRDLWPMLAAQRGQTRADAGDLVSAEADAQEALALDPHGLTAMVVLASVAVRRADPSGLRQALDVLQGALQLRQWRTAAAALDTAVDALVPERVEQALQPTDLLLAAGPEGRVGPQVAVLRAELLYRLGRASEAVSSLQRAEEEGGMRTACRARHARAAILAEQGDLQQARRLIGPPSPQDDDGWARVQRARVALAQGRPEEARREITGLRGDSALLRWAIEEVMAVSG